jgi:hypothetical protein
MKKYVLIILLAFLLIPSFAQAENTETIEIKGVIGDFAPQSRTYEVDGKIYEFDEDITIQTPSGDALTFADLKGGMKIKIIGEKVPGPDGKEKVNYIRIIVMKNNRQVSNPKGSLRYSIFLVRYSAVLRVSAIGANRNNPLPPKTVSQSTEPVIPDERRFAGRDPESSESSTTSFGFWFPAFAGTLSGSRLASAAGGLGRDDEL